MEKKSEAELRAEAPVAQTSEKARSLAGEIWERSGHLRPDLVRQAQGATPVLRDRGPRNPELTKAVRVLLSYVGESIDAEPINEPINAEMILLDEIRDRSFDPMPAASEHLGRRITQRIIEAIGSTGQPESAEDALTRLLAALMEAQAARGRAEGQLLQQQDAQLRQEQDVVTDLRNKIQMLTTERDGLLTAVSELKKGAGHAQLSARSQVGDRVQQPITGRWGTVMEVQGGRTLVRWDGAIAKPDDGDDAEEESDEGASW